MFILNKLKKRLANTRPAKRPQGKVPARSNKRKLELPKRSLSAILEVGENVNKDNNADINSEDINNEPENTASNSDTTIDERHYASLNKEQRKSKPNKAVVNKYLNVKFASRKECLQATRKEDRPRFIIDTYPCFKDPSEVLEKVRRSLSQPEEEDVGHYLKTCVENLKIKLDHLIYYGISKSALRPPTNISDGRIVKVIHLMKGLNNVFKPKGKQSTKQLKAKEIFHVIEGDEGPCDWQRKRSSYIPGLAVSSNGAALLLGRDIFIIFSAGEMVEAVITLIASFYLMDLDYPSGLLVGLSIMQQICFGDSVIHPDGKDDVIKAWNDLQKYCSD
ncbi:Hypothetical predicted protein [Paramuricea clavata]|uniref:Uncharacterized protein n=1 Tax=Paramuricea clavata TaxID=317549 RepID=A0A6S7I314_PARCT|nr:Hypothetical predicted protein [Paramuricea clavata]